MCTPTITFCWAEPTLTLAPVVSRGTICTTWPHWGALPHSTRWKLPEPTVSVLLSLFSLFFVCSFSKGNFDTIVDGIVQSIVRAHNDIAIQKPGARLLLNSGKLYESNINRSPNAYLNNPAEERALYPDGNTDKTMVVARLEDADEVRYRFLLSHLFAIFCACLLSGKKVMFYGFWLLLFYSLCYIRRNLFCVV